MTSALVLEFDAVFAWLGSHPSLATRKDATVEVVLATCLFSTAKAAV